MQLNLKNFFQDFVGEWLSQKNIYLLDKKMQKKYNHTTKILLTNNKYSILNKTNLCYNYNLDLFNKNESFTNTIRCLKYTNLILANIKKSTHVAINYHFITKTLIKICWNVVNQNLLYEEYLYSTNKNLKICIGNLKNLDTNQYIAISVTSYIRLK
uniref:Uncharacterized protein n=1 Tax=Bostrychia moritziana TaxID=103713 RepID=A0A1Z1M7B2_BOSMO|nr:hypothetical protein [Bostrychia moritziana]ARW61644.1 hypothetical protein [Bostrychia moritziana]